MFPFIVEDTSDGLVDQVRDNRYSEHLDEQISEPNGAWKSQTKGKIWKASEDFISRYFLTEGNIASKVK